MEFVRQIINSSALEPVLTLPPSFHNVQVEVIVLPVDNRKTNLTASFSLPDPPPAAVTEGRDSPLDVSVKPVKHSAFGRLKAYANPSLIPEEEGAWERATAEKYALH